MCFMTWALPGVTARLVWHSCSWTHKDLQSSLFSASLCCKLLSLLWSWGNYPTSQDGVQNTSVFICISANWKMHVGPAPVCVFNGQIDGWIKCLINPVCIIRRLQSNRGSSSRNLHTTWKSALLTPWCGSLREVLFLQNMSNYYFNRSNTSIDFPVVLVITQHH